MAPYLNPLGTDKILYSLQTLIWEFVPNFHVEKAKEIVTMTLNVRGLLFVVNIIVLTIQSLIVAHTHAAMILIAQVENVMLNLANAV